MGGSTQLAKLRVACISQVVFFHLGASLAASGDPLPFLPFVPAAAASPFGAEAVVLSACLPLGAAAVLYSVSLRGDLPRGEGGRGVRRLPIMERMDGLRSQEEEEEEGEKRVEEKGEEGGPE